MKKFIISEEEKSRILGMHHNAIRKEFISEQMAGAGEPEDLAITQPTQSATPTPAAGSTNLIDTTPIDNTIKALGGQQQGTATPEQGTKELHKELTSQDKDYEYKKVGDKYYFKLKENPVSEKAKGFLKQGKFKDWTQATNQAAIDGISKLKFTPMEKMELKKPTKIGATTQTTDTTAQTSGTIVGSGGSPLTMLGGALQQGMQELQKQFPNIASVDSVTQGKLATWSKSPAGQYILNTPADQREKAMDNLDKMFGGDPLTKELKKPIRQALGMKADNIFGRIGQQN